MKPAGSKSRGPAGRRKLVVYVGLSLDGRFQGLKNWDLDFLRLYPSKEITDFCVAMERKAGALLLGRRTYEGFAAYWPRDTGPESALMNGLPKVVFSHSLTRAAWSNSRIERRRPETVVRELKRAPGKDLFVFGSGRLVATLAERGLIDEYWIHVQPAVLWRGKQLFKGHGRSRRTDLDLLDTRVFRDGSVLLRYRPRKRGSAPPAPLPAPVRSVRKSRA